MRARAAHYLVDKTYRVQKDGAKIKRKRPLLDVSELYCKARVRWSESVLVSRSEYAFQRHV